MAITTVIKARLLPKQRGTLLMLAITSFVVGLAFWATMTVIDRQDTHARSRDNAMKGAMLLQGQMELALGTIRAMPLPGPLQDLLPDSSAGMRYGLSDDQRSVTGSNTPIVLDFNGQPLDRDVALLDGATGGEGGLALGQANGQRILFVIRMLNDGRKALVALPMEQMEIALLRICKDWNGTLGLFWRDGTRVIGFGTEHFADLETVPTPVGEVRENATLNGEESVVALRAVENGTLYAVLGLSKERFYVEWLNRSIRGALVFAIVIALIVITAGIGYRSLRREERMRMRLVDSNRDLESRVRQRTKELRLANEELHQALDEKDRANQAKSRFLAAANHDLRQPFQSLRLYHHLLSHRLADPQDQGLLAKMGQALENGERLLHSLLEVATLDAGIVQPQLEDFSVDDVLIQIHDEFCERAEAKGLRLKVRRSGLIVRTDRALLLRMLSDLVSNAITYTTSGGVLIGCRRTGHQLRIEVWDSGAGIPEDQYASIFEDFVQLGNPERNSSHGLGLGLAKLRRKAELLNHPVSLRSRLRRGSVFAVTVPLAPVSERGRQTAISTEEDQSVNKARKLLLVEDDDCQREGLVLLLEEWGYKVVSAVDGQDALEALHGMSVPPDLILTDFRLPGDLNGVDIVDAVQTELRRKIPGIIMTGDTAPEIIRDAVDAGCRLLHKPYLPSVLHNVLESLDMEILSQRSMQQTAA